MVTELLLLSAMVTLRGAHPGSGLEVAGDGTIYLADVARETIWSITPQGEASPLVENSWTHELHLAADDALVYEREHTGFERAPQSIWTLRPGDQPVQVVAPPDDRSKFGSNAFARANNGDVYFAHTVRGEDGRWRCVIRRRAGDDHDGSRVTTIAGALDGPLYRDGDAHRATFRMIVDMQLRPDGTLYLLDRDRLRVLSPDGRVSTLGPRLIEDAPTNPPTRGGPETTWNRLYGLCVDDEGNAYVAYFAGRRVIRIAADGTASTAMRSSRGWTPLGVAIGPRGRLHVSEAADRGQRLRVLRSGGAGPAEVVATIPSD